MTSEVESRFVGTWELMEWVAEDKRGGRIHPMGTGARGVICYTADGFVHVHIMKSGREDHASSDTQGGTDAEYAESAKSHIAYSGRYVIEKERVLHHVAISSFPNWTQGQQVRFWKFVGDDLELSTEFVDLGGQLSRQRLTWRRL